MKLSAIDYLATATVTDADAAKLAEVLDLTAETGSADTAFLKALFARALDAVERHTGRVWRPCTMRLTFALDGETEIPLPVRPVSGVSAVTLNGEPLTGYALTAMTGGKALVLAAPASGELTVDVAAGYAEPLTAPPAFEAAVLAVAADMYEHREAQSEVSLTENRTLKFVLAALTIPNVG